MDTGNRSADGPPDHGERPTVFISYTAVDEPWAVWVAWHLQEAGYRPRLQAWPSVPGHNFVGWINGELRAAAYIVAILSPAYLASEWAEAELNAALAGALGDGGKLLVPVRVAPCETPELLRSIGRISLVDRPEAEARSLLVRGLHAAADGQVVPAEPPPYPGAPDHRASPPYPGPDRAQLTARLLDLVEQACRLRHPDGTIRRPAEQEQKTAFPYLDVAGERDGERQRWPVGVSVEAPDTAVVAAFYETVVRRVYLPVDEWVGSELVHLGEPPPEEVWPSPPVTPSWAAAGVAASTRSPQTGGSPPPACPAWPRRYGRPTGTLAGRRAGNTRRSPSRRPAAHRPARTTSRAGPPTT